MASKSESIGLRVRAGEKTRRSGWKALAAIREWSSSMHVGPSRSAQLGRHTGARI